MSSINATSRHDKCLLTLILHLLRSHFFVSIALRMRLLLILHYHSSYQLSHVLITLRINIPLKKLKDY